MSYKNTNKKNKKIANDPSKHYPNKNESELLRRIMSETNLNEEEVRSIKKYRKLLSEASKAGQKQKFNKEERYYRDLIKQACKKTGLAKEHPLTLFALDEMLTTTHRSIWRPFYISHWGNVPAATIVLRYGKKSKVKQS